MIRGSDTSATESGSEAEDYSATKAPWHPPLRLALFMKKSRQLKS
ncbi:unnamed protein product [Rhodiola kirilowii]